MENVKGIELLNLWKETKLGEVTNSWIKARNELTENDKFLSKLKHLEQDFHESLEDLNSECMHLTHKTLLQYIPKDFVMINTLDYFEKDYAKLESESLLSEKEIRDKYNLVLAHLHTAETRADVIKILKDFKIIDNKGNII